LPVARLNYDNIEEIKSNMTQDKEETIKKIGLGILIKVDIERKCLNVTT